MRASSLLLLLAALGGCALDRPAENAPPGSPPPGQWTPAMVQQPASQPPPAAPAWQAPPWQAPQPQPPAAQPSFPWPAGWVPQAPPIALPQGWPGFPGFPGWPQSPPGAPQGQPLPQQPAPGPAALPGQAGDVAQRCVDGINRYRATKGLTMLGRWAEAEGCAAGEAGEDALSQRPHGSFGKCREMAQNACPNWSGPAERMIDECLRMMWNEGPGEFAAHGHYENMASPKYTQVSCGVHTMADGRLWAVQDFR